MSRYFFMDIINDGQATMLDKYDIFSCIDNDFWKREHKVVYFIYSKGKLLYVGKSKNILRRIRSSSLKVLCIDKIKIHEYENNEDMNNAEIFYISKYKPNLQNDNLTFYLFIISVLNYELIFT